MNKVEIIKNFIEDKDCETIIQHLEKLCASGDVVVRDDGRIGVINKKDEVLKEYVDKYFNKTIKTFNDGYKYFSGYIVTKYNTGVGMDMHTDSEKNEEMGALMYLNDDYEGGEIVYTTPDGIEHSHSPQKGDMVYCPSWYPHGVNKVTSGTRYFFTVSLLRNKPLW